MRFQLSFVAILMLPAATVAQQITIQQPVIQQFGVTTSVSVPDRGRTHVGSVSRAGSGRKSFGPFRNGSSVGLFREHSGISAGVYIHDLETMDKFLLGQTAASRQSGFPKIPATVAVTAAPRTARPKVRPDEQRRARLASAYYKLALKAESRGSNETSTRHFRRAANYGSLAAKARLRADASIASTNE